MRRSKVGWSVVVVAAFLTGCPEAIPPSVPLGFQVAAPNCGHVVLAWAPSVDTGGSGLRGYRIYRDGVFVTEVAAPATSADVATAAATLQVWALSAIDRAGNESLRTPVVSLTTPTCSDQTAPTKPTNLTGAALDCASASVSWSPSTDAGGSGLRAYRVYRGSTLVREVPAPATTATDTNLAASKDYDYKVSAVDWAGNDSGKSSRLTIETPSCTSGNLPPIARAGADQYAQTLTSLPFSAAGSSDPEGAIAGYAWSFGDGSTGSGASPSHAYAAPGTYTVTLTVTDGAGATATDTATCVIANRPPVAAAGADRTANPGAAVAFDGSASADPDGRITTHSWTFGDGSSANGATASHAYASAGTYTVTLTVTDDRGSQASDTAQLTVSGSGGGGTGSYLWSRAYGGPTFVDIVTVYAVAVAPDGSVVVTGSFGGTVNLGGGALTSAGGNDAFVAKYAAGNGAHVWSKRFGGTGNDYGADVAVDDAGNVVATGGFSATVDFGGSALVSAGNHDAFLMRLSAAGGHLWSTRGGGAGNDGGATVAVDANRDVLVAGTFEGTAGFGGSPLSSAGESDVYVARYAATSGAHQWSKRFGGNGADAPNGIAVDGAGRIALTGVFANRIDFGGGNLNAAGALDVFVAQLTGASGAHQWSQRFGSTGYDYGTGIATDASGNVAVTGLFEGTVDFGGGALVNAGGPDIFVLTLSSGGAHRWSKRFGTGTLYAQNATGVAFDANGGVVFTGNVIDTVNFGGGSLPLSGGYDPVVVKLSATGTHVWSKRFGCPSGPYNYSAGLAVDSAGNVVTAASFSGTIDVMGHAHANAGGLVYQSNDALIVKLAP